VRATTSHRVNLVSARQWKRQGPEAKQIASHDTNKLLRFNLNQIGSTDTNALGS